MNLKRLADYVIGYAFVSAEGDLPEHELRYTDGVDDMKLTGAKADKCRVSVRSGGRARVSLEAVGKDLASESFGTVSESDDEPIDFTGFTTVNFGGAIANWKEVEFGVDNGVLAEILGTTLTPSVVESADCLYSGHLIISRAAASKLPQAIAGGTAQLQIAITDNQSTPVTKTFTWAEALYKRVTVEVPGAGLELERIEWESNGLVIS